MVEITMGQSASTVSIVVADDDVDDRLLIEDAFDEVSIEHELNFAEDGEELLELLRGEGRYADGGGRARPDLILLDINMPRMDGLSALKEIRADPKLHNIPIVIFSTSVSNADVSSAYSAGANSYISKPWVFEDLVKTTKALAGYWGEIVRQSPEN
jgi:CheY-like chemotaxis protein